MKFNDVVFKLTAGEVFVDSLQRSPNLSRSSVESKMPMDFVYIPDVARVCVTLTPEEIKDFLAIVRVKGAV